MDEEHLKFDLDVFFRPILNISVMVYFNFAVLSDRR